MAQIPDLLFFIGLIKQSQGFPVHLNSLQRAVSGQIYPGHLLRKGFQRAGQNHQRNHNSHPESCMEKGRFGGELCHDQRRQINVHVGQRHLQGHCQRHQKKCCRLLPEQLPEAPDRVAEGGTVRLDFCFFCFTHNTSAPWEIFSSFYPHLPKIGHPDTNCLRRGTNCFLSQGRHQKFGGERPLLAVVLAPPAMLLQNGLRPAQAKAMEPLLAGGE